MAKLAILCYLKKKNPPFFFYALLPFLRILTMIPTLGQDRQTLTLNDIFKSSKETSRYFAGSKSHCSSLQENLCTADGMEAED